MLSSVVAQRYIESSVERLRVPADRQSKGGGDFMQIRNPNLVLLVSCLSLLAATTCVEAAKKKPPKPVQVSEVVSIVSNSLSDACGKVDSPIICKDLTGVDITLHTEIDKDGHIGVSIFGVSIGGHREQDVYNEFSVHLGPPQPETSARPLKKEDISSQLSAALRAYADAATAAKTGQYPLDAKCFYLEVSFTVQYGGGVDTSGLSLTPISPDISGKIERKNVQTIRLSFGKCS
jgi:hypothetical protein